MSSRLYVVLVVLVACSLRCQAQAPGDNLQCRILGSSSMGGYLIRFEGPHGLKLSDVVDVLRDGARVGEAWVTRVAPDGTVTIAPQFKGQIRSTDKLVFARRVDVLGTLHMASTTPSDSAPIDPKEQLTAEKGTAQLLRMYKLSRDAALIARVDKLGQRIAKSSPRAHLKWTFEVLDTSDVNAMTVGFGRVYVTRGLLEMCDDEELAGALAHEVAHACLRHLQRIDDTVDVGKMYLKKAQECQREAQQIASEQSYSPEMQRMRVESKMAEAREWLAKAKSVATRIQKWKTGDGWDQEYEADRLGMLYAQNAGYRPQGMVDCLEKLAARQRAEFFKDAAIDGASTHPPMEKRIDIARTVYRSIREGTKR